MWTEVPKKLLGRSNHTLAAVLKLIDMQLPQVNKTWANAETEKLSNEISVNKIFLFLIHAKNIIINTNSFHRLKY